MNLNNTNIQPIFLIGVQRSGTTLLRLLLDSHSLIAIPHESFVLIEFAKKIALYNNLQSLKDRRQLVKDLLASKGISKWNPRVRHEDIDLSQVSTYADLIHLIYVQYAKQCGKEIWGDKTPSYIRDIHILNNLFPKSRFIHIIRDGRDVALSLENQPWGPIGFISALKYWKEVITWSRKMGMLIPSNRYMEVKYEELLFEPEKILRQIMEFLELPFENSMIESFYKKTQNKLPQTAEPFHGNLKKPIDKKLAFKWRDNLSYSDQALAYRIAGEVFKELGYPLGNYKMSDWIVNLRKVYHFLKEGTTWRLRKFRKGHL